MPVRIHHIALRTPCVSGLAEFYRAAFGLRVVREALPRFVWLGLDGDAVIMIEAREPGEPAPAAGSLELVALRVDEAHKTAIRKLARERGCYDGETAFTVYLRDPEGRRIAASTYDFARTDS